MSKKCRACDAPMLPAGRTRKNPDAYRHASGCPLDDYPVDDPKATHHRKRGRTETMSDLERAARGMLEMLDDPQIRVFMKQYDPTRNSAMRLRIADLRAALDQLERRCWCGHPFAGHQKSGDPRFTETICNGCNDDLIRLNDAGLGVCHEPSGDRPDSEPDAPQVIPREVEQIAYPQEHDRAERAIALVRRFSESSIAPWSPWRLLDDALAFLREIDGGTPEEES